MDSERLGYNAKETKATVNQILDRLKAALGIKTDTQLAHELLVKPNTISSYRDRNSMDFTRIFAICERKKLDLNYIIFDATNISEEVTASRREMLKLIGQHELRMESFIEALSNLVPEEILDRLKDLVNGDLKLMTGDESDNRVMDDTFERWIHVFLDHVEDNFSKKVYDNIREVFFQTLRDVYAPEQDSNSTTEAIIRRIAG